MCASSAASLQRRLFAQGERWRNRGELARRLPMPEQKDLNKKARVVGVRQVARTKPVLRTCTLSREHVPTRLPHGLRQRGNNIGQFPRGYVDGASDFQQLNLAAQSVKFNCLCRSSFSPADSFHFQRSARFTQTQSGIGPVFVLGGILSVVFDCIADQSYRLDVESPMQLGKNLPEDRSFRSWSS